MNQIDIFRAFSIWSRYNIPTANQRSLFYGLLEVWNDTRLVRSDEWLSVPNRTLETISGLSQKTCDNVKNQLQQQGILKIIPGKRNKDAAKYNISFWINVKKEEDFTVIPTVTVTPKLSSDVTVTSTPKLSSYTEKSRTEKSREESSSGKSELAKLKDFYVQNFGMMSPLTYDDLQHSLADYGFDLSMEAMIRAVRQQKSFNTALNILKYWESNGIKTLEDAMAERASFERKKTGYSAKTSLSAKLTKGVPEWSSLNNEPKEVKPDW